MATLTLRPDAVGDITQLSQEPPNGDNYEFVDDVTPDEAATTVYEVELGASDVRDLYNLPDHSTEVGTINNVRIYVRVITDVSGSGTAYCYTRIKTNAVEYTGVALDPTSWTTYNTQYDTNPQTTNPWTWGEIDALQAGVRINASAAEKDDTARGDCTQVWVVIDYSPDYEATLTAAIGLSATLSPAKTLARALSTAVGLQSSMEREGLKRGGWLCVASRDGGSVKTSDDGANWSTCAQTVALGGLPGSHFAQYLNRLCVLNYEKTGFSYSAVNDIVADWTNKPDFPNLMQKFTDLFVARDAGDDPVLNFLTPTGMYYLDVFTNFVFGPSECTWEEDDLAGKKGLYWKGDHYIAVGKGIYRISKGVVTLVGPDMDDGLPEHLQGTVTDMIGVGFWLVIAVDGGASKKSSILKRYITGKHWHPVYVGSVNTPIQAVFWDSGTLYFGEGSNVKSLPFPNVTDNVKQLSDHDYCAAGELMYPYFHSIFEAMTKVAHKVWATTQDCNADEAITIYYRIDEDAGWTSLGSFITSPRPTALPFPASGDSIGVEFERIQLKAAYARGGTTTNSPKLESLILEYRVTPPVLWGWDMRVMATTSGDRRGQDIIDALIASIESRTLLSFYPSGDKDKTEYFVEVKGMPSAQKGTEFGQEGIYDLSVEEVIE